MALQYQRRKQEDGTPYPRRKWIVQIEVQGDTEEDVIANLKNFLTYAEREGTSWESVGCGVIVSHDIDDSILPGQYEEEIRNWNGGGTKKEAPGQGV